MPAVDWQAWHDDYDVSDSPLYRRLLTVQAHVRAALDTAPSGPLRVVSGCAGQGRDLLDVLAEHPRREDVTARLVELGRRSPRWPSGRPSPWACVGSRSWWGMPA
jgi:hypothetical protein